MNNDRAWMYRAYPEDDVDETTHAVQVALDRRDNGGEPGQ